MATNVKALANNAWKNENLSISGILKYVTKSKEKNLIEFCKLSNIDRSKLTIDSILNAMTDKEKNRTNKAGEIIEQKKFFSLWTVLTALARANKK